MLRSSRGPIDRPNPTLPAQIAESTLVVVAGSFTATGAATGRPVDHRRISVPQISLVEPAVET